ncbi:outer membrane transport energization protein ExbD [Magnetococcus marinus MC-1]|uniref:Outer membrane transport energization protein ExbD n=1 Tax=Magnetococcus marinus (strain ATCC BAA-1437 / JCM 17883 / MC-1) TaxID=156889 RepID=A0LDK5_MAGMM|nr:biopolymer transporter ExbD [Magnetococcus marinus]ABK46048.1 outer membrane transport energization protein ExbD [Magnetococcus marinus MC-1]
MMGLPDDEDGMLHEINVTPLVDVMLVLLVIFIIAAPLMARALQLKLPQVAAPSFQASQVLEWVVLENGQWQLDGTPLTVEQMEARLQASMAVQPECVVRLSVAAQTPYDHVAAAIALAKAKGVTRLAFATQPLDGRH